jgi:hypothetical protein
MVCDRRCRGIVPSWGRIDQERQVALFDKLDLLIGIDSGPFHLAMLSEVPVLGVFREILPWRCSLPNPRAVNLVGSRHVNAMRERSDRWHFWQYSGNLETRKIVYAAETMINQKDRSIDHLLDNHEDLEGDYLYKRVGHDHRILRLDNDFKITTGSGRAEREWRVVEFDGKQHIMISGEHGLIADCEMGDDGIYRGAWTQFECMPIELIPAEIIVNEKRRLMREDVDRYLKALK